MRGRNRLGATPVNQDLNEKPDAGGEDGPSFPDEDAPLYSPVSAQSSARATALRVGNFVLSVSLLLFLVVLIGLLQDPRPPRQEVASSSLQAVASSAPVIPATCGPLTRELLQRHAVNGTILVTFADSAMFELYGATWLRHLQHSGMTYWMLAAADGRTAAAALRAGATQCFLMDPTAGGEAGNKEAAPPTQWGSKAWQLNTWGKVQAVRAVQLLGFHVLYSDLDAVWLRDPLPYLSRFPEPDVLVSLDPITSANPLGDDGLELGVTVGNYMNTGVYFVRNTAGGRTLMETWYSIRHTMQQRGLHDQDGLYRYLEEQQPFRPEVVDRGRRLTRVLNGTVALAQLPATLFQNAYSHTINKIHQVYKLEPYAVHFVWVWGQNEGKMHRMREARYFADPPEYYSSGQFLTVDLPQVAVPEGYNEWTDTAKMVNFHLATMQAQLDQLYYAFALAHVLNRTLILPKLQCFCIQNWFEAPRCRLPGETHTRFPLVCPADFYLDMRALAALAPAGRRLVVREHSFLENDLTPAAVRDNIVEVRSVTSVGIAMRPGTHVVITLPLRLSGDALLASLASHQSARVLRFASPRDSLGMFYDTAGRARFDTAVSALAVKWCCRPDAVAKTEGVAVDHVLRIGPSRTIGAMAVAA